MMNCHVRLSGRIAFRAVVEWRRTSFRWCNSEVITYHCKSIWLIHSGPIWNPITELSEAYICISCEVFPAFKMEKIQTQSSTLLLIWLFNQAQKGKLKPQGTEKHTQSFDWSIRHTHPPVPEEDQNGVMWHAVGFLLDSNKSGILEIVEVLSLNICKEIKFLSVVMKNWNRP